MLRVPLTSLTSGRRRLDGATSRYVARVHRLAVGDALVGFDPVAATEADASVVSVERGGVEVEIGPLREASLRPSRRVVLAQGVGKGDKLDAVVRDATELAATHVAPFWSERTVARRASPSALERWRRVALEAARQSGRGDVPRIDAARPLDEVVGEIIRPLVHGGGVAVALAPQATLRLGGVLERLPIEAPVAVLVGPEGGLSEPELARLSAAGLLVCRLGDLVLRTETVAAAALGALLARGA